MSVSWTTVTCTLLLVYPLLCTPSPPPTRPLELGWGPPTPSVGVLSSGFGLGLCPVRLGPTDAGPRPLFLTSADPTSGSGSRRHRPWSRTFLSLGDFPKFLCRLRLKTKSLSRDYLYTPRPYPTLLVVLWFLHSTVRRRSYPCPCPTRRRLVRVTVPSPDTSNPMFRF